MKAIHGPLGTRHPLPPSTVDANRSVDPRLHLCGSVMLLFFMYHISRCTPSGNYAIAALASLLANFVSFGTSTFCHWMEDSGTKLASSYFLVDYIGIVLHIWAISLSVLLLEAAGSNVSSSLMLGITLAGMLCVAHLMLWPREKRQRVLAIGVFGALALCGVSIYNILFSSMSQLTASYTLLALTNGLGGWFYCRGTIRFSIGSLELFVVSGHLLMHLCSLVASIFHALTLASVCCIAT